MSNEESVQILALAGSYRSGSFNQSLLAGVRDAASSDIEIVDFDLRTVPFFDQDLETAGEPQPVQDLKQAVSSADAVLFITPEYNSGVPAVLKNGLDWSSRIYPDAPIGGKLVAVIGASPGRSGTKYAQANLKASVDRAGAVLIEEVELMLDHASDAIEDGVVTSDDLKAQLASVVDSIVKAVAAQRSEPDPD